jgi:hypothetical protein
MATHAAAARPHVLAGSTVMRHSPPLALKPPFMASIAPRGAAIASRTRRNDVRMGQTYDRKRKAMRSRAIEEPPGAD